MTYKTNSSIWSKVDILEVSCQLNGKSFTHGFNIIVCSSLIRAAYEHFCLESYFKTKFQYLKVLPRCLITMN